MGYPNMSYCMFENTVSALSQILADMKVAQDSRSEALFMQDLSESEKVAFEELRELCELYIDQAKEFLWAEEYALSDDEDYQPSEADEWYDFDPDC